VLKGHLDRLDSGHPGREARIMPDARLSVRVTDDREMVAIVPAPSRRQSHQLELTLDELDKLIGELGDARRQMVKGRPSTNFESEDVRISVVANTTWCIKARPPEGALLAFDHPRFGPVGFTLPSNQVVKIVSFLTERFILQPTPSAERH
jgi:hypothetical protein